MTERAVGHVVDDDGEVGVLFDERLDVGEEFDRGEERHGDFEIGATPPQRWHEGAADPVAGWAGCGAETDSVEAVLLDEAAEVVGGEGVFGVYAADSVEDFGVTLQDAGQVGVVPTVVDDLDEDGVGDAVGLHEGEERFGRGVFGGWMRAGRERELRVVLPDVDVRVDERGDARAGEEGGELCRGGCGCCGGKEAAAVRHGERVYSGEGVGGRLLAGVSMRRFRDDNVVAEL